MNPMMPFSLQWVSRRLIPVLLTSAAAASGQTQTLPRNFGTTEGNGGATIPFAGFAPDQKWQWVYDSGEFSIQAPVLISQLYVRASGNASVSAFSFPSIRIVMASSPNDYKAEFPPLGQDMTFANNLAEDQAVVRPASPWTGGPVPSNPSGPAPFFPLGLTSPFLYDPSLGRDLVVQIEMCGNPTPLLVSIDAHSAPAGSTLRLGGNIYGDSGVVGCNAISRTTWTPNDRPMIIGVDYTPAPFSPLYEVNSPGANCALVGSISGAFYPQVHTGCSGESGQVDLGGVNAVAWDLGMTGSSNLLPRNAGGILIPSSGQVVNLDLANPALTFLGGLQFSLAPLPWTIPFVYGASTSLQAQLVRLDPTSPAGFLLSAALQLRGTTGTGSTMIPGPAYDDWSVAVPLRFDAPNCQNSGMAFYGTIYSTLYVNSNGIVAFDDHISAGSPLQSTAQNRAMVCCWMDMDPSHPVSGPISITMPLPGVYSVNWSGVAYQSPFVVPTTATFEIQLDTGSGAIGLFGLAGIQSFPGTIMVGISPGNGATNPGPVQFMQGSQTFAGPTAMVYSYSSPISAPAASMMIFNPVAAGGYNISAF